MKKVFTLGYANYCRPIAEIFGVFETFISITVATQYISIANVGFNFSLEMLIRQRWLMDWE